MLSNPAPVSPPEPLPEPCDVTYPGTIRISVDLTDVERRIFSVVERIPIDSSGKMTLLYPKWLPGYHSPRGPVELFAGLRLTVGGRAIPWRRHPTEVTAFQIDVPYGAEELVAQFQFLSPTCESQGDVEVGQNLLFLNWNKVLLYPAGHFARRITVEPAMTLPEGWHWASALDIAGQDGATVRFSPVPLDVLVDSPVLAARHLQRMDLDPAVRLNIAADTPDQLEVSPGQLEPHRNLIAQCDRLFGARPFDRFEFLVALTDDLSANGIEHHSSCEIHTTPDYFKDWEKTFIRRDTFPHEYIHSWNGKHRRGADSWTPSFDQPIRNSLMWVYEGQTQYWDRVLCARSGLWSKQVAREALAETAGLHHVRSGESWRPISDTTRDPILAGRSPLPWPSWQRSEDYYTEGSLIWLDVDTRIRELTEERRSLDDFARAFFGEEGASQNTSTYTFHDVANALHRIAPFDWRSFFDSMINQPHEHAPLAGLERGGYKLVFRDRPSAYQAGKEAVFGVVDLLYSVGLTVASNGEIMEVLWGGPAFDAKLIAGSTILCVNGADFSPDAIKNAVASAGELNLTVATGKHKRDAVVQSPGHRYPHLERVEGTRARLDEILEPLPERAEQIATQAERIAVA